MNKPTEDIRTYHVEFRIGTAHYETDVQAYGKDTAEKLVKEQYKNSDLTILHIEKVG